ncbi:hypothetical protein H4R99_005497 [Coemansia sp. RSA 1722]|nr:hypothetical protein IWW45_004441 [Coemansia sp. RSA 485]KAJ2595079.1 hypothetical protein H4R99_005497 [Coemansia sp. RSA 1722]
MPCTFFVPSSMFTLINQALAASAQQRRRWEQFNQPNVVVIHTDAPEPTDAVQNQDNFPSRAWTMDELYESPEGGMQLQRPNLTYEQAQEITAVIYFHHYTDGSGLRQIQLSEMSHANVIELYQTSLRDSPSTPTISRYFRFPSSRDPSLPRGSADRSYQTESGLETAYTVFRMHRAYRLHATVMDIFCRGAMYVVSQLFRPEEFMRAISRYGLHKAELTYQEIKQLVEYIEDREGPSTANWIDLLKTLRFVYTESDGAATEFGSRLHAQLPDIKIVRTRFGSYVDPVA